MPEPAGAGEDDEPARTTALARAVVGALMAQGRTLATAESLTGGLLAAAVTSVPGASAVFRGGVVAYATDVKHSLVGVDAELLARVGPVDRQVAVQLANGVRERLGADFGLSTTGVAGPDRQDGHPAGVVWIGVADERAGALAVDASGPATSREAVRQATVQRALRLLLAHLAGHQEDRLEPGR